jgi:hypothetical protein
MVEYVELLQNVSFMDYRRSTMDLPYFEPTKLPYGRYLMYVTYILALTGTYITIVKV